MNARAPFFERPMPLALTFGAFFAIALPLALLRLIPNDVPVLPYLLVLEAAGLGTSHFFLTLAVYFDRDTLGYFAGSWRRQALYFGVPLFILLGVALFEALRVRSRFPAQAFYFFAVVRFFDFFHVGRQSAGVLQIWKRPLGAELEPWTRHAENTFFVGMALLQWQTFWYGGTFSPERTSALIPAVLLGLLALVIVSQYVPALQAASTRSRAAIALGYFAIQALCAAAAAYATWLYLTVLAVHYVEYHVLMAPRWLGTRRRSRDLMPFLLYGGLVMVVIAFEARNYVATTSVPLGFMVHLFDGIFLLHYTLDAFLWKFSNPYYRATLAPLYFQPATPKPWSPRTRTAAWAGAAVVALLIALASVRGVPRGVYQHLIAPLAAEEHMRWGMALAEDGDLAGARYHLGRAAELAPSDERPRGMLAAMKRQLQRAPHD
jgi:hypothetical protein